QFAPTFFGGRDGGGAFAPLPPAPRVPPAHVTRAVTDVGGAHPHEDDALFALKTGRGHVHPTVVGVVVPRPALGVPAVPPGRELRALSQVVPADAAVVGPPDLGPDHVAEATVDDGVQVQRITHAQQI